MSGSLSSQPLQTGQLSGLDKASILMLSLPEEYVGKILKNLHPEEIQILSKHMSELGSVSGSVVEALYKEFSERVVGTGAVKGSYNVTEKFLSKVFEKEKVDQIMREIRGPEGRTMWDKLSNVSEEVLASYFRHEYPQTVAVILSKIRPDHASKVLSRFPHEFSMDVVNRMLKMEPIQRQVLEGIEETLRKEFVTSLGSSPQSDPHAQIAEIFNAFDRNTEERFMKSLEEENSEAAEKVKSLMFTFEDLIKLDSAGIQTLIRVVDKTKLALSLKGAPEALKTLFFGNMSERAAKLLREDMEGMGPVRLKEVDEAQAEIVLQVKDMINTGEVTVIKFEEQDEEMIE